eukprot:m.519789 g.519789  ORF g.519789 m.519789 type:complete len:303 (-) comp21949_c0_seq3:1625-2533(-)
MINNSPLKREWLHRQPSSVDSFADALHKARKPSVSEVESGEVLPSTEECTSDQSNDTENDCAGLMFFDLRSHLSIDRTLIQRERAARLHAEEAELFQRSTSVLVAQSVAEDPHIVSRAALQRLRAARLHEEEKSLYAIDGTVTATETSSGAGADAEDIGQNCYASEEDEKDLVPFRNILANAPVISSFIPGLMTTSILSGGDDGRDMLEFFIDAPRAALQRKRAKRLYDEELELEERAASSKVSGDGGWKPDKPTDLSSLVHNTMSNPIRHQVQTLRAQRLHTEERQLYDLDKLSSTSSMDG